MSAPLHWNKVHFFLTKQECCADFFLRFKSTSCTKKKDGHTVASQNKGPAIHLSGIMQQLICGMRET